MATKDWKKTRSGFKHKAVDGYIDIIKTEIDKYPYLVQIVPPTSRKFTSVINRYFSTKVKALSYSKQYMRTH